MFAVTDEAAHQEDTLDALYLSFWICTSVYKHGLAGKPA